MIFPVTALAAAVKGDAKYTCDFFEPILPGKLRLVVEMQTSAPFSLPNVSSGPPRHAPQLAFPIRQPASSKIDLSALPFHFVSFSPRAMSVVAGTMKVSTAVFFPYRIFAAARKSVSLPPVHEPMYTLSTFTFDKFSTESTFSGECGFATSGGSLLTSYFLSAANLASPSF